MDEKLVKKVPHIYIWLQGKKDFFEKRELIKNTFYFTTFIIYFFTAKHTILNHMEFLCCGSPSRDRKEVFLFIYLLTFFAVFFRLGDFFFVSFHLWVWWFIEKKKIIKTKRSGLYKHGFQNHISAYLHSSLHTKKIRHLFQPYNLTDLLSSKNLVNKPCSMILHVNLVFSCKKKC